MSEILERNLERLIAAAPPRERLSRDARERLIGALEAVVRPSRAGAPPSDTPDRRSPRTWRRAASVVAVAAGLLVMALLGRAWWNDAAVRRELDVQVAGVGESAPGALATSATSGTMDAAEPDPESTAHGARIDATDGIPGPPLALSDSGTGAGAADGTEPSLDLTTRLTLEDGAAVPETVSLWVRAAVPLPLVADPVTYDRAWAPGDRSVDLSLESALRTAEAFGVDQVHVHAEAPGLAPAWTTVSIEEARSGPVSLVLGPGRAVRGFVIDAATGTPLEGALVVAVDQLPLDALAITVDSSERLPMPSAFTDARGGFVLPHLAGSDEIEIRASHQGFAPTWAVAEPPAPGSSPAPLTLALAAGAKVRGVVERPDGTRWARAVVVISRQDSDPATGARRLLTFGGAQTGSDGAFEVEDLPPGTYVALHFGDMPNETTGPIEFRQITIRGDETLEVNFFARQSVTSGSLAGRLVNADGTPLARQQLTLGRMQNGVPSNDDWRATQTGDDGSFLLADLALAEHAMFLATDSYRVIRSVWAGPIDGPTDIEVRLPATELIVGAVAKGSGESLTGAWCLVDAYDQLEERWNFVARGPTSMGTGETEPVLRLAGLEPGRLRLQVVGGQAGFGSSTPYEVDLVAGEPLRTNVEVPPGGTLRVAVTSGGEPAEGLSLVALDMQGNEVPQLATIRTSSGGRAEVPHVPYGSVTLRFSRGDKALGERTVSFTEADDEVQVRLE